MSKVECLALKTTSQGSNPSSFSLEGCTVGPALGDRVGSGIARVGESVAMVGLELGELLGPAVGPAVGPGLGGSGAVVGPEVGPLVTGHW